MFGTQIDDPVTMTTPLKADPVVTGAHIHGFQIRAILLISAFQEDSLNWFSRDTAHLLHSNVTKEGVQLSHLAVNDFPAAMS